MRYANCLYKCMKLTDGKWARRESFADMMIVRAGEYETDTDEVVQFAS